MLINSALRRIWVTFQLSRLISVVGKQQRRIFLKFIDVWIDFSIPIMHILAFRMLIHPECQNLPDCSTFPRNLPRFSGEGSEEALERNNIARY